jgi:hypothetical protein
MFACKDFPLSKEELTDFWKHPEHYPHLHMMILRVAVANGDYRGNGEHFYDAAEKDKLENAMAAMTVD